MLTLTTEIARIIREHPDVAVAAIIEPGAVGEIVVNSDMKACDQKATSYREGIVYALKALNLDNVMLYLDAAHGGVLGWRENVCRCAHLKEKKKYRLICLKCQLKRSLPTSMSKLGGRSNFVALLPM